MTFKKERGYLSFALGDTPDYLRMAYAQALSIKLSQKNNHYCVVVDQTNVHRLTDNYLSVFDEVVALDYTATDWDMSQDYRAYSITPWRETIMLNADMLVLSPIDHWWSILQTNEVVLTKNVLDFRGDVATSRAYRKLFGNNLLPDVYAGFTYFRSGKTSSKFFYEAERITRMWDGFALRGNTDPRIKNDEVFALAALETGVENVTLPCSVPTFVHGKERMWGLNDTIPWYEQLYTQWDELKLRVGHHVQDRPFHYHHKEWLTDDIIDRFEQHYFSKFD